MIIYRETFSQFIQDCNSPGGDMLVAKIVDSMRNNMGRGVCEAEEKSWRITLRKLKTFLIKLDNKDNQYILLEFKVPLCYKRIDVILVGADGERTSLLIIELKGWDASFNTDVYHALKLKINASYGEAVSHPSAEARDYKRILTERFSDIRSYFNNIDACSLLPNYKAIDNDPLLRKEFESLINEIRCFYPLNIGDFQCSIKKMFNSPINKAKVDHLNSLEYKPTIDFQKSLKENFEKIKLSQGQQLAFDIIKKYIDDLKGMINKRRLLIISGLPGTGKTVIAFKLLAYIWKSMYGEKYVTAKLRLPGPEFRESVKKIVDKNFFKEMIGGAFSGGTEDVTILDEAHKALARGGYGKSLYEEIFRTNRMVILLIDDFQVVSKKGISRKEVEDIAKKHNYPVFRISLHDQFRNAGDSTYTEWLKYWIFSKKEEREFLDETENTQEKFVIRTYKFNVMNEGEFNAKYNKMYATNDVRMGSFWTQDWMAEIDESGNPVPKVRVGSSKYVWNINKFWINSFLENHPDVPRSRTRIIRKIAEKNFITDKNGAQYIAYYNTIQGSEFDHYFVHIPKLFFLNKDNQLDVDLSQLSMEEMKTQMKMVKGQPSPKPEDDFLNKLYFKNRLLVHLTRGKKATYIYCEDKKLAKWIESKVIKRKS